MNKIILSNFKQVILWGTFCLFTFSCTKLQELPKDFTSPDNFYQSKGQIESAFASSMNRMFGYWQFYDWMNSAGYVSHDDQLRGGNLAMSDGLGNDVWRVHYRAIADLNPAIKALNDDKLGISATQEEKDQLMAQAKFLRAFNYFTLVRLYGDVPLIIETTNAASDPIVRNSIVEVYKLIESDLLFATQKLPVSWPAGLEGRPSMDAAKTLLAKVYITMATFPMNDATNYAKARDMAKQVIDAGTHHLETNIEQVFELANQWGPEMLWSFHTSSNTEQIHPQIWLPGEMSDGWGDVVCDRLWAEAYPEQPRKHAYLLLEDYDGNSWTTWDQGTPSIKKYLYDTRDNFEKYVNQSNLPILRYPDVLLLFAEADNMASGSPTQAAVNAVNLIINRANGNVPNAADPLLTTGMSKDAFDKAVIQQRNLELCFEYDRWFDLIRKRILREKTIPAYQQNFSDDDYLLPIPQADLRLNPALTQNPGYTSP